VSAHGATNVVSSPPRGIETTFVGNIAARPCVIPGMDALVIGQPDGLARVIAGALRRRGRDVLQAIPADVAGRERATWLLTEAGWPPLVLIVESAPFATVHELLAVTHAEIVLVAEQRTPTARAGAVPARYWMPRDAPGLTVVPFGRAGRRWFVLGPGRHEPMGAERAAAVVLRSCAAAAASCR
jgi:hypothetical protein